ncbi:hypothetical protein L7F22_021453 [Adiantum nelumboides]|nr:hypothetical protein [Adiantum nelumboides]
MAKIFLAQIIKHHGVPKSIVSDRDPRMTSLFWQALFENLGTKLDFPSAYHPQTDGKSEIANATVLDLLKMYVFDRQSEWEKYLPLVEFAYNNTIHSSIGKAPFEVIYGKPLLPPILLTKEKIFAADEFVRDIDTAYTQVQRAILQTQEKQKREADKHKRQLDLKLGQYVLLKFDKARLKKTVGKGKVVKLSNRFYGPFKIIEVVNDVTFRLELPSHWRIHNAFHVSLLRPYVGPPLVEPVKEDPPELLLWIERPVISPPLKDDRDKTQFLDQRLRALECRQAGLTYKGQFTSDICYQWNDQAVMRFSTSFGQVPVMVKSCICHLRGADQKKLVALKEEASEAGGYFICNGNERIIRMLVVTKRNHVVAICRSSYRNRGPGYTDMGVLIRCVRPDQSSVTVRLYYMQHGSATLAFSYRRQEFLIPVGIILKALSHTQDKEIFELLTSTYDERYTGKRGAVGTQLVIQRAQIILEEVRQVGLFTRLQCLEYLGERFRPILEGVEDQPAGAVGERVLEDHIFVHLDTSLDKFHLLIFMLQKLFALADHTAAPDNVDALQHQEILLPGHVLTMYAKDRMQDWLGKVKRVIAKELEEKPSEFDLQDVKKVQKLIDKVPASTVGKRFEFFLNTGNLALKHNLELMQSTGYTVVAERLNYLRYISHFRSVHRGAYFQALRTTTVRKLLPESWGFLCPVHTPDGTPCGLLNHLTVSCEITPDMEVNGGLKDYLRIRKEIVSLLCSHGMVVIAPGLARCGPPSHLSVLLDGRMIGHLEASRIPSVVIHFRQLKVLQNSGIPADLEAAYVPCTFAGAYPGLFLSTGPARMVRPVRQLFDHNLIEMIGPLEQVLLAEVMFS